MPGALARLSIALLLGGCTGLPDYAQPRVESMPAEQYTTRDGIRYRQITREDFRAAMPPPALGPDAARMGAFTCANVVPAPGLRVDVRAEGDAFVARLVDAAFHAEMDRDCSWWNTENDTLPADYVLQHEQIHFGLTELRARLASVGLGSIAGRGASPQAAADDAQRQYDAVVEEASHALLEQNRKFDEETSGRYAPQRQAEWMAYVEGQLARTAGP